MIRRNRDAIELYEAQQRAFEEERYARILREMQPEPVNFRADEDVPASVSPWIFWPVVVTCSLILTFVAYELATRVLPVIWGLK